MKCLGCGVALSEEDEINIRTDVKKQGGNPDTFTLQACSDCPPEAIADFEYRRLSPPPGVTYEDYRSGSN